MTVALGTLVHHGIDAVLSGTLVKALSKAMKKDISKGMFNYNKVA